jgi:hypothetical protein
VEGSAWFGRVDGVHMSYLSISACASGSGTSDANKFLKLWLCPIQYETVGTIFELIRAQHAIGSSICSLDCCAGVTVVEMAVKN